MSPTSMTRESSAGPEPSPRDALLKRRMDRRTDGRMDRMERGWDGTREPGRGRLQDAGRDAGRRGKRERNEGRTEGRRRPDGRADGARTDGGTHGQMDKRTIRQAHGQTMDRQMQGQTQRQTEGQTDATSCRPPGDAKLWPTGWGIWSALRCGPLSPDGNFLNAETYVGHVVVLGSSQRITRPILPAPEPNSGMCTVGEKSAQLIP